MYIFLIYSRDKGRSDRVLEFKNVIKQFETVTAVNNVSFALDKGKVLGIVGRNGSRKVNYFQNDFKFNRAY